jgi:hypothetical protein
LRHNQFLVKQGANDIDYLIHWLATIGAQSLRHLNLLSINCTITMAEVSGAPVKYDGAFRKWHELVACLAAFGLDAHQLRWIWVPVKDLPRSDHSIFVSAVSVHFFAKYTLDPLLVDHELFSGTSAFDVISDLAEAEQSENCNEQRQSYIGNSLIRIKYFEDMFAERHSDCCAPWVTYAKYVQEVFNEPKESMGRFYDLKYIHKESGVTDFTETREFQDALQAAVEIHRGRYRHQREWNIETNISGPRPYSAISNNQPHNLGRGQTGTGRAFINTQADATGMPKAWESARPNPPTVKWGESGFAQFHPLKPRFAGVSVFDSPDQKQQFHTDALTNKSPFAALQTPTKHGARFTTGFSTRPAPTFASESKRQLLEAGVDDTEAEGNVKTRLKSGMPETYPQVQ